MNKHEDYLQELYKDITTLYENTLNLNTDFESKKINQREYMGKKYAYMCNGVYLTNVVEELQREGIEVIEEKIELLNYLIEYLSQDLKIEMLENLEDDELFTIEILTKKYQEILPIDDFLEDAFLEDDQI